MKRFLFILLIVLLAGCAELPPGEYAVIPLGSQAITPGEYVYEGPAGRYVVHLRDSVASPEAPTATPTRTPPPATVTPTPTLEPTPTPEQARCFGRVNAARVNVRATPWGEVIGQATLGQILTFEAKATSSQNDLWYRIWWEPGRWAYIYAALIDLDPVADCSRLPTEQSVTYQPQGRVLQGAHLLFSAQAGPILRLAERGVIQAVKCLTGAEHICEAAERLNPEIVTVYRDITLAGLPGVYDCVSSDQPAAQAAEQIMRGLDWPPGYDFYVYQNECDHPLDFQRDLALELMKRNPDRCLALFSYPTGVPELAEFLLLRPVFQYARANPCGVWPDGSPKHHAFDYHSYSLGHAPDDPFSNWTLWRFDLFYAMLPASERLPIILGEFGIYADEAAPVDCGELARQWRAVSKRLDGSEVLAVMWWSFGDRTQWRDLTPCAPVLEAHLS